MCWRDVETTLSIYHSGQLSKQLFDGGLRGRPRSIADWSESAGACFHSEYSPTPLTNSLRMHGYVTNRNVTSSSNHPIICNSFYAISPSLILLVHFHVMCQWLLNVNCVAKLLKLNRCTVSVYAKSYLVFYLVNFSRKSTTRTIAKTGVISWLLLFAVVILVIRLVANLPSELMWIVF